MITVRAAAEMELRKRKKGMREAELRRIYEKEPLEYIHKRLKVPKEKIDWMLHDVYKTHQWDGTPNPLKAVLDGLAAGNWVGVESAVAVGKTFLGACIVLWFLECFENSIVVTTAPKQDQLALHIWKEIMKLYKYFKKGELTNLRLRMKPMSDEWAAFGFVAGVSADEESATKAQGFHAEHLLIIMEETPGIPDPIITAFQNTCSAEHNLILAFGNPDHQLDNLHRFCKLENVKHIRISSLDHPNIVLNDSGYIPGAASKTGLERMLNRLGSPLNPLYQSRVRGLSPAQSQDSLIKLDWLYEAISN